MLFNLLYCFPTVSVQRMARREKLFTLWILVLLELSCSFVPTQQFGGRPLTSIFQSNTVDKTCGNDGPIMDTPWEPKRGLEALLEASKRASVPCAAETREGAHDAFRYEWGRWIDNEAMEELMKRMNEIQLAEGVYDTLVPDLDWSLNGESGPMTRRYRVAGGDYWDCILHVLPQGSEWKGRWPTGSWAVVRALTGVAEIAMLRGPNRDGFFTKSTKKSLRGGGDGTLAGGSAGGGEDCVKYVGGALRSYSGKSGKTTLLEVVVRPPIGKEQMDGDGRDSSEIESLSSPEAFLQVAKRNEESRDGQEKSSTLEKGGNVDGKPKHLGTKLGMSFEKVGGLDDQLNAIVRRVLASRANPTAAKRLGVNHVRGILLSGPPGCGKTLLARSLAHMLGAREPQIVNGPEILDKFVGEAEKNIRALFAPAEIEYNQVGDASALHLIVLDEVDAIARKRGSVMGDSTGVRDSVVNQLLAKMDGVKEANNVLVVGLTNRPELLDPALLRPGRLEVQMRIELPDTQGRRDILRIHTRQMIDAGGMSRETQMLLEDLGDAGFPARTEYFTGAELAGLVRSAASFALARTVESDDDSEEDCGIVSVQDLEKALQEVRPALGKQDDVLEMRYPNGISAFSPSMERLLRDLNRFVSTPERGEGRAVPKIESLMLVGSADNGGTGATALACWAAVQASTRGEANFVRLVTSLDLLTSGGGDEASRAAALVEKFTEAQQMTHSILILDDVDHLISGSGPHGYSSVMVATLRALLRSPPSSTNSAKISRATRSLRVLAATSRNDAGCVVLHSIFDETLIVPQLSDKESVRRLIRDSVDTTSLAVANVNAMADLISERLGAVGCKTVLRLLDRSIAAAASTTEADQLQTLQAILDDLEADNSLLDASCTIS